MSTRATSPIRAALRTRRNRLLTLFVVAVLLLLVYVWTVLAYGRSLGREFVPPNPDPDVVALELVPTEIDGENQVLIAELLVFPGSSFLDDRGRMARPIEISVDPTVSGGVRSLPIGAKPTPKQVIIPISGLIERYPFDHYRTSVTAQVTTDQGDPIPTRLSGFFKVPGWNEGQEIDETSLRLQMDRSAPTITIVLIFVTLMAAIALLCVLIVLSTIRGRFDVDMKTAAWMSAVLFALIAVRNGMPGDPPLGSWIDVTVTFWVIAIIMLMVIATVLIMLAHKNSEHRSPTQTDSPA